MNSKASAADGSSPPVTRRAADDPGAPIKTAQAGAGLWLLLIVFIVALAVRAGWGVVSFVRSDDPGALQFPDEQQYWQMARSLRVGDGLVDELGFRATRMPLYPGLLSLFADGGGGVVAAKVMHWLCGALAASLTAGLAGAMFNRRAAGIAGLLVAFDPFLVFFSSLLLTETLAIASLVGLWWLAWPMMFVAPAHGRWKHGLGCWLMIGALGALAVHVREASLALVAALYLLVVICRRFDVRVILGVGLATAIVVASLVPWAMRNHRVTGEWCWLTLRGGISLYDGVGPQATGASDLGDIKSGPAVAGLGEVEWNRYFLRESVAAIKADPGRILHLAGVKLARMWNPLPNVETHQSGMLRFISAAWTIPIFALAVAGIMLLVIARDGTAGRKALWLLLPALCQTALHSVFVGSVRYRLVAVPMIEVLSAVALAALLTRVLARTKKRELETTVE